ncbi:Uncharacterised protein [Mycobacteroides abscessus subsp. abscessus]|nr:Uncharacterised protein [Mycobacteroides abscessus subsp. abscessus]
MFLPTLSRRPKPNTGYGPASRAASKIRLARPGAITGTSRAAVSCAPMQMTAPC